jgi:NAD(P)-dependent dehydrogenase (short-subunit alcohol dehydrogenase family)
VFADSRLTNSTFLCDSREAPFFNYSNEHLNAGTVERGPFLDSSDQSYDKHFNLNVRSLIELSKDSAKRMVKTGWGRIINIGSAFGEAAPVSGFTP